MTEQSDQLGWTLPTPGDESEAGEWGAILNAALDDEIEPAVAEALGAATLDGSVIARYYDDAANEIITESFSQIQPAVDALPLQENEYSGATGAQPRTAGDVIIASKSGDNPYDGQVILDKKGTYRALGRWTELSHDVTGEPTVLVAQNDEPNTPDDVYIQDLWVEHMSDGVAIKSNDDETHLQDINLERSGDVAIELTGERNTAVGIENKGGAFKVTNKQGYYSQILSHNEVIGYGKWPAGFIIGGKNNTFSNCHGWLANSSNFDTTCVKILGNRNLFSGSCSLTKHGMTEGKPTFGLQFGPDATKNRFAGRITSCQTGVAFGSSADNYVYATFTANGTPVDWGTGVRNVVNGQSVNAGNPASTGGWNGFASRAFKQGVTVWDTSATPAVGYTPTPGGSWRSLNTTSA